MADELKDYKVTETRFIGGHHRVVGEPIQMSERAAKYYVAPYGTGLKLARLQQTSLREKPMQNPPIKRLKQKADFYGLGPPHGGSC